ncbi:MAG: acyl-ACP--UDP-N-acetylglucosamine O-acyltransferase [Candidatus Poribacteria bacterium]
MPRVHPTAIVHPGASIGDGVEIGPFCIVEDNASIGARTWLDAHVKVCAHTRIGEDCRIYYGAVVGHTSVDLKSNQGACGTHIGARNVLREYVTISASSEPGAATVVGDDNLLMNWANLAHDCVLGDHVVMANFATLGGHVQVEGPCRIGAHVGVHQFVRIGRGSMAGACSKFTQDLPPYMVADGHPGWVRGLNILGRGTAVSHPMADVPDDSVRRLKRAYRLLFRSDLNIGDAVAAVREQVDADPHVAHLLEFIESSKRGVCRRGRDGRDDT